MPPRSKNGSTISSQLSRTTTEGGGRVAPDLRHSISQITSPTARTTAGGMMRAAMLLPIAERRLVSGGRLRLPIGSTRAVAIDATPMFSDLTSGIFMCVTPRRA
jgi:hypothetical protein